MAVPAPDLVIFDCDGVLVDSEVLVIEIERVMLAEVGVELTSEQINRRFTGKSDVTMNAELQAEFGVSLGGEFAPERTRRVADAFDNSLRAVPGIAGVLDRLAQRDIPCCVASSSLPERIRHSLRVTGLIDYFGGRLFSGSMVARGKPAPDVFLFAAEQSGEYQPGRCVVIEDSPYGVQGAVAAGMTAIGFTAGGHMLADGADRLVAAGAHHVAATASQLQALLLGG